MSNLKPGLIFRPTDKFIANYLKERNPEYNAPAFLCVLLQKDPAINFIALEEGSWFTLDPDSYMKYREFFVSRGMYRSSDAHMHDIEIEVKGQIDLPKPKFKVGQRVYVNYKPEIWGYPRRGLLTIHDIKALWLLDPVEFRCWGYRLNETMAWRYLPESSLNPTMESFLRS